MKKKTVRLTVLEHARIANMCYAVASGLMADILNPKHGFGSNYNWINYPPLAWSEAKGQFLINFKYPKYKKEIVFKVAEEYALRIANDLLKRMKE